MATAICPTCNGRRKSEQCTHGGYDPHPVWNKEGTEIINSCPGGPQCGTCGGSGTVTVPE